MKHLMMMLLLAGSALAHAEAGPTDKKENMVTMVRNVTRVKILESNNVTLRPGSVYENITVFESLLDFPKPGFNYEFIDSGLGAAEPLYPLYQKGYQGSWGQLVPALFSKNQRHIDHYTALDTPEHCRVEGLYGLRHINEYPSTMFAKERAEGYEQIVVRLEYYTRLTPDAQCGRHLSHDPDPNFKPMDYVRKYHASMTFAEFPQKELAGFEWKISAIHHLSEVLSRSKWPRFDLKRLDHNSLWYYEKAPAEDYGVNAAHPQPGLASLSHASQLMIPADENLRRDFPIAAFLRQNEFKQLTDFLSGKPFPGYDPASEPGHDTFRLADVTTRNVYTSGLESRPIEDAAGDVMDPNHYALVAMTVRPYEERENVDPHHADIIPQVRFVFQLMDPRSPGKPLEQLFFHAKFDVVDRAANQATRDRQHEAFLRKYDELLAARERKDPNADELLHSFIREVTSRPVEALSWSSSLTGIWVFGQLGRDQAGELRPVRIMRDGVDVGFYSSVFDNDAYRTAIAKEQNPERKKLLEKHLEDLVPTEYRDPRRQDTAAISFNRMTCAQCHQMSGRDGVHLGFNDGIDRRWTALVRPSEYLLHESDRQLKNGPSFWAKKVRDSHAN